MDEATRMNIFEPFFTTKGERGTGLGMAMVYGTIKRHSAAIEIDSALGAGKTVSLIFGAAAGVVTDDTTYFTAARAPESIRVLVIDDDPLLTTSLCDTLEMDGHAVTVAPGGQEGIDAFAAAQRDARRFHLVITDLGMPHVDGRKVSEAIKAMSPGTPVVMLTGWGQRLIAENDVPPHVDRILNKPPKLREIRAAVAELPMFN
jgi:CheY-like chemotaxis protein